MRSRAKLAVLSLVATSSILLAACGGGGGSDTGGSGEDPGQPQRGGAITVLLGAGYSGAWPTGLDPATNTTGGANQHQMNAIFGRLFKLSGEGKVVPSLAAGYDVSDDGKSVEIQIREGVQFQDGTPFDAEAVAWHFQRVVDSPCNCAPTWPLAEEDAITTEGDQTVVLRFSIPYAAFIPSLLVSNANWVASPTALEEMGEDEFKIKPVGAGPFKVVSNKLSSELVLERNPNYWDEGKPYLDRLVFKSIGGDQAAYQALLAGEAEAYEGMTVTPLIEQARNNQQLTITQQPATSPYVIQLNTHIAPFDDKRAREAIYHATNVDAIREGLFNNWYPVSQMFTGPGGKFHHAEVPGYRTYDLQKAKSLVNELGGLEVTIGTLKDYVADQVNEALKNQWEEAGIKTTVKSWELSTLIQEFNSGQWEAMLQTAGSWDPAAGVGVGFRFASDSPYTGVKDPKLDQLLDDAAATLEEAERDRLYQEAGKYISDQAYAPFMFAFAPHNLAVEGVHGPGLTTPIPPLLVNSAILWEDVWRTQSGSQ